MNMKNGGIEKKIILIISVIIGIVLLIGIGKLVYDQVKPKNPNRIEASYIGENHIVGEELKIEEFKVEEVYNGQTYPIEPEQIKISKNVLGANGASVLLQFVNREGKTLETTVDVACLTEIEYVEVTQNEDTEFYIDYAVTTDQFTMMAYNKEGYSAVVPPDFYTIISDTVMEDETTDFEFEFINKYDELVYNPVCTVTGGVEMYAKEIEAKYIGETKYYGQSLNAEEFEITATLGNGEEWPVPEDSLEDFVTIENPYLEKAFNQIEITFLNPNGTKASTTIEVPAYNYCTSISSAVFIGDPKSVGDVISADEIEVTGKFYDGDLKKITGFELITNSLSEEENTIELTYTNEVGDELSCEVQIGASQNIIFIGDERIKDLEFDVGDNGEKVYFVSNENADYDWLVNQGIAQANAIMKKNSLTSFRVVFMCGIDDMDRVNDYIALYKKVAKDTWPNQKIFVASITPVDEELIAENSAYDKDVYVNADIKKFNEQIQTAFKSDKSVKYINTYGEMINGHLITTDGFLLDTESNIYYYELVKALTK